MCKMDDGGQGRDDRRSQVNADPVLPNYTEKNIISRSTLSSGDRSESRAREYYVDHFERQYQIPHTDSVFDTALLRCRGINWVGETTPPIRDGSECPNVLNCNHTVD